jgi:glycerol-3-phosphate cytidylyltransferase
VTLFDEPLPNETLTALRPQLHVKGGDYEAERLPETALVRAMGGEVVIIPLVEGRSTTDVVRRILEIGP